MIALITSVGYGDILALTLPRNVQKLESVLVITAPHDFETKRVVSSIAAHEPGVGMLVTDAFYRGGAKFNRGAAIEEGFKALGYPERWFVVLDADIVLPWFSVQGDALHYGSGEIERMDLDRGCLYVPPRRMLYEAERFDDFVDWSTLPINPNEANEYPGYFQMAHGSAMKERPWYPTNWIHAGGADSEFMKKWPRANRKHLPFEVLHLGADGRNWAGRVTQRLDGIVPEGGAENEAWLRDVIAQRDRKRGPARYEAEKLK